ncbi:MAG: hypothetical protein RIE08_10670 [Acidimicrobiales bacterium]
MSLEIRPVPTPEEAAAIVAAAQATWLSAGGTGEDSDESAGNARRWRFSGRWWREPAPLRRQRPRL